MKRGPLFLGVVLFVAWATAAQCAQRALVQALGQVTINNSPVSGASSAQEGDLLVTNEGSAALTGRGYMAQVAPHSTVEYRGRYLTVSCGLVSLSTTTTGAAVRSSTVTAWPAESRTVRFRIETSSDAVRVTSIEGSVWVNQGGTQKRLLQSGSALILPITESSSCKYPG